MTATASMLAPRLGHVIETGANGTEIRKNVGFKGTITYYIWQKDATIAMSTKTLHSAREMGGLPQPVMGEKAERAMVARHALAQKTKATAQQLNSSHKGTAGRK